MKTSHLLISIGAAALASSAALAQTAATETTTRTVHTTTTTSAAGGSAGIRHRTVVTRHRPAPRRYVRGRSSANRTASRTTTTTTVTQRTVVHPERYDYNRPDPSYGGYYADRYYRDEPRYRERVLAENDRVYVGRDNRYYCRRSDGTTGLIVGGITGGVLGNVLTSGRSETLGTLLGGAAGALAGRQIDRSSVRCR